MDIMKSRRIIFTSELDKGIMHKPKPPPPSAPAPPNVTDSEPFSPEEETNTNCHNNDPSIAVDVESDVESVGSNRRKKKGRRKKKSRNQRARLVYDRANNCWVPKWLMLMGSRQNTIDKDMVKAVGRLRNMFKGSQAKFSTRAKRIIAVSSLAAAGASDYGVQSVIFRRLKAITEEMKMGLSDKELASGCPDVRTIRNWELGVAAGCMAKVISQIARDAERMTTQYKQKLQITLVTDHGTIKRKDDG